MTPTFTADQFSTALPEVLTELNKTAADLLAFIKKTKPKASEEAELGEMYGYLEIQRSNLEKVQNDVNIPDEKKIKMLNGAVETVNTIKEIVSEASA
jgi:hypothetical protein